MIVVGVTLAKWEMELCVSGVTVVKGRLMLVEAGSRPQDTDIIL